MTDQSVEFSYEIAGMMGVEAGASELIIERAMAGKALPVFVYGTLRPGDYNHDRFPGGVVKIRKDAQTPGRIYFPGHRGYPGARFDEEGTIVGDLLWYDMASDAFLHIFLMELGAGYTAHAVEAIYTRKTHRPRRKTIQAVSFQKESSGYESRPWEPVPGNDWFSTAARKARIQSRD